MITLENVSKSYAKGQPALNDVSVEGTGTDFRNKHCYRSESRQDDTQKGSDIPAWGRRCISGFPVVER